MIKYLAGGLAAFVLLAAPALAAPAFPPLTGRVVDEADILSAPVEAQLTTRLEQIKATTHHQVVVATIKDLKNYEIEDYGYQLGRAWKIGDEKLDDGVLLIIAPNSRKVRIEVGYGVEPILTDALSSVIIQSRILPTWRPALKTGSKRSAPNWACLRTRPWPWPSRPQPGPPPTRAARPGQSVRSSRSSSSS